MKSELKDDGLEFGHALHVLLRRCAIYSAVHPSTEQPREKAFSILSEILKSFGQLTFGFANGRILINNILTSDASLRTLRQDFHQRGIGAVVFSSSLTAARFKEFVELFAITPKALAAQGGAKLYFEQNQVEGARVILSPEHGDAGDLVLSVDGSQLISQDSWSSKLGALQQGAGANPIESLLEAAALQGAGDPDRRFESMVHSALSGGATDPADLLRAVTTLVESSGEGGSGGKSSTEVASNLIEDLAARWAVDRLSTARTRPEIVLTYEGVAETLSRALATVILLQNTLAKVAHLSEEGHLDSLVLEMVRSELAFVTLPLQQQVSQLRAIKRYSTAQFRQLLATIKALLQRGDMSTAAELAKHYVEVVGEPDVTIEELSRIADLFQLLRNVENIDFFSAIQAQLLAGFTRISDPDRHQRLAYLLGLQGRRALEVQDWDLLLSVVDAIEASVTAGSEHDSCCRAEIDRLVQDAKLDDALEGLISRKDVRDSDRNTIALCRAFGPCAAEKMAQRLEIEQDAAIRLRLVRALAQSGESSIRVLRPRLNDPRWYVVRNACVLLGDLGDPDLLNQLAPLLTHPDERVQMSAAQTLLRKRVEGREKVFSERLVQMSAPVAEVVFDEILLMRNPATLSGVDNFLMNGTEANTGLLLKAVQVAEVVDATRATQVLGRVLGNHKLPANVRRAAAGVLQRSGDSQSLLALQEFVARNPADPIAIDCRKFLQRMLRK